MNAAVLQRLFGADSSDGIKRYRRGTHRSRTPRQTLDWIAPKLSAMGITRVADITGLDRIGIPVTMVVRPNARSLAVSQGKGLSLTSARVSGIMESVETYHAERIDQPLKFTDATSLRRQARVAGTERMAKSREHRFNDNVRILWIAGVDLLSGENVWVPFESVHADFTLPRHSGSGYFPANTNGLASGNSLMEAAAHALYEVMERDAVALWHHHETFSENVVDPYSIKDGDCAKVLAKLDAANLNVRIWNVTSDVGVPCFHCLVIGNDKHFADAEFGSGCHPDSQVALLRALTEAVQARTTFIAGSRDDFGFAPYTDKARSARFSACNRLMTSGGPTLDFQCVSGKQLDTVAEDLAWVLDNLTGIGIDEVIWVDLTLAEFDIPVGRIIVPGLEGAFDSTSGDYVPGQRACRRPPS